MSWFSSIISNIGGEISHIASSVGGEVSHIASSVGGEVSHIASSVGGEVGNVYAHVIRPALPIIATGLSTIFAPVATPYLLSSDIGIYGHAALTQGISGVINPNLGDYEAGAIAAATYGAGQLYSSITAPAASTATGTSTQLLENLSNPSYNPLNPINNLGSAVSSVYNTFSGVGKDLLGVAGMAGTGLSAYNLLRTSAGQPAVNILGQIQPNGLPGAAQAQQGQSGSTTGVVGVGGGGIGLTGSSSEQLLEIAAIAVIGGAILAS